MASRTRSSRHGDERKENERGGPSGYAMAAGDGGARERRELSEMRPGGGRLHGIGVGSVLVRSTGGARVTGRTACRSSDIGTGAEIWASRTGALRRTQSECDGEPARKPGAEWSDDWLPRSGCGAQQLKPSCPCVPVGKDERSDAATFLPVPWSCMPGGQRRPSRHRQSARTATGPKNTSSVISHDSNAILFRISLIASAIPDLSYGLYTIWSIPGTGYLITK